MKVVSLETIIDTLWWYKTWQHSGYNHTNVKQNLLRKQKKAFTSSWSQRGNQRSPTLTIPKKVGKACEELTWNHCTSTPHRSETTGIAERAVRRIKEGPSAVLLQSGLGENGGRIPRNASAICEISRISCLMGRHHIWKAILRTSQSTNYSIWGNGRISPYFCQRPVATTSVWVKSLTWNIHRLCIARGENLERRHLGRRHRGIGKDGRIWNPCKKKTQCKRELTPTSGKKLKFPVADGTEKLSGGEQVLSTSTLIRDCPDRGEEEGTLQGESDGSSSTQLQDSSLHDGEARNDVWDDQGYEYIVRCNARENIDDYWNVDGDRDLSDTWTGFTRFTISDEKTTGWIYLVREETDKKANDIQTRLSVARNWERHVRSVEAKRKAKVGYRKTEASQCQKIAWCLLDWSRRWRIQGNFEKMRVESWKFRC